jgi:uncharacterized protein involved in outer membrane biogenesis
MAHIPHIQKKWLVRMAITVAGFLVIAALIPFLIPADRFRILLVTQLHKALGREVTVEFAEVTLLSGPGVALKNVVIQEDPQFSQNPFLRLKLFRVRVKILPLLTGKINIASLSLDHPEFQLIKNQAGHWNYESLALLSAPTRSAPASDVKPSSGEGFSISSLSMNNAVLDILDGSRPSKPRHWRQEGLSLRLRDFSPSKGGEIDSRIDFPGNGGTIRLTTMAGPFQQNSILSSLLKGEMKCASLSLATLRPAMEYLEISNHIGEGLLQAHFRWDSPASARGLELTGEGKIEDWTRGGTGHAKLNASFDGSMLYGGENLQLRQLKIQFPQSQVSIAGSVQFQKKESLYNLDLGIPRANFADILQLIALAGSGTPEGISASGSVDGQLHLGGTSLSPALNGKLAFSPVTIQYPGIKEPIQLTNAGLSFEGSQFRSGLWEMALGSRTRLKGQLSGSWGPSGGFALETSTQAPTPVADVLAMGSSFGVSLPEGYEIQKGFLSMQLTLQKSFQAEATMKIHGKMSLNDAEAMTPFLKVPLQLDNADMVFSGDSAEISRLVARIEQTHLTGKLRLQNFNAPHVTFQLDADQLKLGQLEQWLADVRTGLRDALVMPPSCFTPSFNLSALLFASPANSKSAQSKDYLSLLQVEEGRFTAREVQYGNLVLTQASARMTMARKILEMQDLNFQMYGGKHAGSATLDLNATPPRFSFHSSLSEVNLEQFLANNTKLQNLLSGTLSLNMDAKGSGNVTEEITRNLTGGGKLQLINGSIRSFDLMQQLSGLARIQGVSTEGGATRFKDLIANFTISDGRVKVSDLMARLAQTTLRANGSFGFDKTLDFQIAAELPAALSQGQNWTSLLANISSATFFQNDQGHAVVPLRLRGTVDKPSCSIDTLAIQANLKSKLLEGGLQQGLKSLFKSNSKGTTPSPGAVTQPSTASQPGAAPPPAKKSSWEDMLKGTLDELQKKKSSSSGEKK